MPEPNTAPGGGFYLTPEGIADFLACQERRGRTQETIKGYRRSLQYLYAFLPEDKCIRPHTLEAYRDALQAQGSAERTVHVRLSAANSLLEHYGRRDLQIRRLPNGAAVIHPTITRAEYLRLLQAARAEGNEQMYLIIKLYVCLGLSTKELLGLSAEDVRRGQLWRVEKGRRWPLRLPPCLQAELLAFVQRAGVRSGPVFLAENGVPQQRPNLVRIMRRLCRAARVPEENGNPRCLRRLYQDTRAGIAENISVLIEQAYAQLLEKEQADIGWEAGAAAGAAYKENLWSISQRSW